MHEGHDLHADSPFSENLEHGEITAETGEIVDLSLFEQYNPGAEYIFRFLQIFTAMCASFAHGSNDVR